MQAPMAMTMNDDSDHTPREGGCGGARRMVGRFVRLVTNPEVPTTQQPEGARPMTACSTCGVQMSRRAGARPVCQQRPTGVDRGVSARIVRGGAPGPVRWFAHREELPQ